MRPMDARVSYVSAEKREQDSGAKKQDLRVALLADCSASTPQTKAEPDNGHTLSEFLTFTGEIKGFLTAGLNARGNIHGQPSQGVFAQTSCATYRLGADDDPQKNCVTTPTHSGEQPRTFADRRNR